MPLHSICFRVCNIVHSVCSQVIMPVDLLYVLNPGKGRISTYRGGGVTQTREDLYGGVSARSGNEDTVCYGVT